MNDRNNLSKIIIKNKKMFKVKSLSRPLMGIALAFMLSACSLMTTQHSACDLRVLSLQIERQSEDAITGYLESVNALQASQEKLNQLAPSVVKQISNQYDADKFMHNVDALNADIDVIKKNKKNLNHIYDMNIAVSETIPGIQAEYNLMVDQMARNNHPSAQVVLAKNQVFIAERILRSMSGLINTKDYSIANAEDFGADVEIFAIYVKAQLEGNPELGVVRVNDPELRSSLESIQSGVEEVLLPASVDIRKISREVIEVNKAMKDIKVKSNEIFDELNKLK